MAVREEFEDEDGEKLRKLLAVVFEYRREITAAAEDYAAKHGLIERFNSMEEDDNLGLKNHYRGLLGMNEEDELADPVALATIVARAR